MGPSEHHPVSGGRLCARGWSAHEASQWGPRLRTPLLREDGELRPASWDEALTEAVAGLERLRDAGRPLGVLTSGRASNEESYLALALARSALRTGHLDAGLRGLWDAMLQGLGPVGPRPEQPGALAGIESSDLVLVLEDDLSVSHPRVALAVLRALRRGARLVTVGWQPTPLSSLASRYVPLDPAAPLATLAGLRAQGGLDGWLRGARRASFVLAPFDADPSLLREASSLMSELAGGLAAPGHAPPHFVPLPIRANTRGALDMGVAPDCLPGRLPLDDAGARTLLRDAWGADGCWDEGVDAEGMASTVAGLVVVGEDLPAVHRSPAAAREQLAALEHLVVVDAFLTDTASLAHVVLPMAAFGESEGTLTGLEDRAQSLWPFQAPPAEARQGWQILAKLLEMLGSPFRPQTLAQVRGAIASSVPGYQALVQSEPVEGWPVVRSEEGRVRERVETTRAAAAGRAHQAGTATAPGSGAPAARQLLLRRAGAFDWDQDALVRFSPTLHREAASRARRFPHGLVAMSASDATSLGVREGWMLHLRAAHGEARVALTVRARLEPGVLLVPFAFREQLAPVLGAEGMAEVEVQPA